MATQTGQAGMLLAEQSAGGAPASADRSVLHEEFGPHANLHTSVTQATSIIVEYLDPFGNVTIGSGYLTNEAGLFRFRVTIWILTTYHYAD
jgi:hypothetical protein